MHSELELKSQCTNSGLAKALLIGWAPAIRVTLGPYTPGTTAKVQAMPDTESSMPRLMRAKHPRWVCDILYYLIACTIGRNTQFELMRSIKHELSTP